LVDSIKLFYTVCAYSLFFPWSLSIINIYIIKENHRVDAWKIIYKYGEMTTKD
jgi:hypothetical protein